MVLILLLVNWGLLVASIIMLHYVAKKAGYLKHVLLSSKTAAYLLNTVREALQKPGVTGEQAFSAEHKALMELCDALMDDKKLEEYSALYDENKKLKGRKEYNTNGATGGVGGGFNQT